MTAYLDLTGFRLRTIMPAVEVDALEADIVGWIDQQLDDWSGYIDARLRKRYKVPFASPVPRVVIKWLTYLVTKDAYDKRGRNSSSMQDAQAIDEPAARALAELKEAADSKEGLFDLPLLEGTGSAIVAASPLGYSEQSPYVSFDYQFETAIQEDLQSGTVKSRG